MQIQQVEILSLSNEEINLIRIIRNIDYGTAEIMVQNNKPTMVKQITQNYKL